MARRRGPVDAATAAQLAAFDQVEAGFRDLGRTFDVEWCRYAAGWVRLYGVDTVSTIRLERLQTLLKAARSER
jgi:hypothetical protein